MENVISESAVVTANENVNAVNNATASEVSMLAIATSGDKKKIHETFGRVDFPKTPKKISKACAERLTEFESWIGNLRLLKAEADREVAKQSAKTGKELLEALTIEELKAELARRSATEQ